MVRDDRGGARALFLKIADLPEAERAAELAKACGDDAALRRDVEALLQAHADVGGFMHAPTGDKGAASMVSLHFDAGDGPAGGEDVGAQIGRYRLLERIGEGGFGTVWMAEQREPVKRRVAVKLIKLGMDTKQVIARFEAERQALAMMDHPHIAKVLDAGATENGRPYFVMEYIRGIPIVAYCDQERLDTKARLELFASVCHAIQHAHQKGIIHRDIKPSNVLVTLHDGVPVPKVIDFGIAKATHGELTTKTLFTEHRQMIGTPAYMSPEQAEMSGLDIDTRSDIYALGVLLYELLTGKTPFDVYDLLSKGYEQMLRIIREEEPPKPSTRVSALGEDTTRTAAARRSDAQSLGSLLRGDLDWIVMKCLEKDRGRRYETANGLAADLQRHLNDEPIVARPPSAGYQLRKFVRRHRAGVVACGSVVAALAAGVVAFAWQATEARDQRDAAVEAKERETEQRKIADAATVKAREQEAKAKEQEAEARKQETLAREQEAEAKRQAAVAEAVAKFQTDMLAAVDPNQLPKDPVTKEPLKDAVTVLQAMQAAVKVLDEGGLEDQPLVEAGVRDTVGRTLRALGRRAEAEPNLRRSLALVRAALPERHPDLAARLNNLAGLLRDQNQLAEAESLFRESLEIRRATLPAGHPSIGLALNNLALLLQAQNKVAEAESNAREALLIVRGALPAGHSDIANSLHNLASLLLRQKRLAEAEPLIREALAIRRAALPVGHPHLALSLDGLAALLLDQNKSAEAEPFSREALQILRASLPVGHPDIAGCLISQGQILQAQNKHTEAESRFREALEIRRAALPQGHPDIAAALIGLGSFLKNRYRPAEAEPLFREALEILRAALPHGHPDIASALINLAALLHDDRNMPAAAEPLLREALSIRRAALPAGHLGIALVLNNLAGQLYAQNKLAEAEPMIREALAIRRAALPAEHREIAESLHNLAMFLQKQGRIEEAEPLFREALQVSRATLAVGHPEIAKLLSSLAQILQARNKFAEAEVLNREALEIRRAALPAGHSDIASSLSSIAGLLNARGKHAEAEPLQREALAIWRASLPAGHPALAMVLSNLARLLLAQSKLAEAEPLLREALEILRPTLPVGHADLRGLMVDLADIYVQQGKTGEALPLLREAIASARAGLPKDGPELAGQIAQHGRTLIGLEVWDEAEPLLRECLSIRERLQPDAWTTFNTRSMLGAALLGQKKFAEAEPLLLAGYRGLLEREAAIPPQGKPRVAEALERIVRLYEAKGDAAEAAAWRAKLAAARAAASRPVEEGK